MDRNFNDGGGAPRRIRAGARTGCVWQGSVALAQLSRTSAVRRGRGSLDWAVATIAAQLLGKHGLAAHIAPRVIGSRSKLETLDAEGASAICVMFLEVQDRPRHIRQTLQRLRQRAPIRFSSSVS